MITQAELPKGVVIEDEADVLNVLSSFLQRRGYRVRGYASAEQFVEALEWLPGIDCIVSDVRLGGLDGIELITKLRSQGVTSPIVLITGHGDVPMAVRAIKAGAQDFIEKPFDPEHLVTAVSSAIASTAASQQLTDDTRRALQNLSKLTGRQKEILDLVAKGLTSKEIGVELDMSYRTVETHRASVMERVGAKSLADLIRLKLLAEKLTNADSEPA